ncbi:uncharacterized protein LOC129585376 [Paramacrobiotus metropolitanus]|uniref:uncharacterized protein LOC129585376 n=1 Tax=Paramacrobiotus metropolitanus TaxID=2943436 RepID=UPI0024458879|nr:uncharacterized protein LOC129585376 [Paramacrobiotus metropolitanus]
METVCSDHNVIVMFRGRQVRLQASDDIPDFTGVLQTRLRSSRSLCCTMFYPLKQRQYLFGEEYGRECNCRKCTEEFDADINPLKCVTDGCTERIPSDERALLPCSQCGVVSAGNLHKFKKFMAKNQALLQTCVPTEDNMNYQSMEINKMTIFKELESLNVLQPDAHLRYACGRCVAEYYQDSQRYEEACKLFQELIVCLRKVYPKYNVERAEYLWNAAYCSRKWLHWSFEQGTHTTREEKLRVIPLIAQAVSAGVDYVKEALMIYAKICGRESKVTHEMARRLERQKEASAQMQPFLQYRDELVTSNSR